MKDLLDGEAWFCGMKLVFRLLPLAEWKCLFGVPSKDQ
jgi:hypothetical protein